MFADGRIVSILKLLHGGKPVLWKISTIILESLVCLFFLTLVLGVCVRFKLKTIYISKR
jgi:hypothetical protein